MVEAVWLLDLRKAYLCVPLFVHYRLDETDQWCNLDEQFRYWSNGGTVFQFTYES